VTKFGSVRSIGVWQVLRDSGELWSTFIGTQIFDSGYLAHFLPQRGGWPIDTYFPNFVNFGLGVPRYHAATFISPSLVLVMFAFVVLSLLQYYAKRLVGKNISEMNYFVLSGSVLFLSRPRSEGWPHHGRTFSIYLYPLSF